MLVFETVLRSLPESGEIGMQANFDKAAFFQHPRRSDIIHTDKAAQLLQLPLIVSERHQMPGSRGGDALTGVPLCHAIANFSAGPFQIDFAQIGPGKNLASVIHYHAAMKAALHFGQQVGTDMILHGMQRKKTVFARSDELLEPEAVFQFECQQIRCVSQDQIAYLHELSFVTF